MMSNNFERRILLEYAQIAENHETIIAKYRKTKISLFLITGFLALLIYKAHIESLMPHGWLYFLAGITGLVFGLGVLTSYSQAQVPILCPYLKGSDIKKRLNELDS